MPLRLKLWKKSQQYNVSDHWVPALEQRRATHPVPPPLHSIPPHPLVMSECQSEIPVAGVSSHCASGMSSGSSSNNNNHKRLLFTSKPDQLQQDSDPIYVNAHAYTMANSNMISSFSSHFPVGDDVSLRRLSHVPTGSEDRCIPIDGVDSDRISLDERRKLLPPYKDPPDYESYVRKKYHNHGSPV